MSGNVKSFGSRVIASISFINRDTWDKYICWF